MHDYGMDDDYGMDERKMILGILSDLVKASGGYSMNDHMEYPKEEGMMDEEYPMKEGMARITESKTVPMDEIGDEIAKKMENMDMNEDYDDEDYDEDYNPEDTDFVQKAKRSKKKRGMK